MTKTVLIAGATGYAGRLLVEEFAQQPNKYTVKALVRRAPSKPFSESVELVVAEVTKAETLKGITSGVDMIVSALGITRQLGDGPTYQDVDYQANMNLLNESLETGDVTQFGYIHVLKGDVLAKASVGIAAKQAFVDELQASSIQSIVICPSGFFSDMNDFLEMAQSYGRIYLFGDGHYRLNPIHGKDLAKATLNAMEDETEFLSVGGPDIFSHSDLATLAFQVTNQKAIRITYIWDSIRNMIAFLLPWVTPISVYGPAQFFLQAFGMDMIGECKGDHHLKDFWIEQLKTENK